jgi:hypothetical protein
MNLLFDSFWRALVYSFRPRVVLLSLAPLLLIALMSLGLGYLYWDILLEWVRRTLEASTLLATISGWMQSLGVGDFKAFLAPMIIIFALTPVIVVVSLLLVALMMTPTLTKLVADRRFPALEQRGSNSLIVGLSWSLFSTLLALLALVVSMPLWLIPPLILVLPPLIWGWLTYRVMAFDALAVHASGEERREIFRRHRMTLLGIGVVCGYLGAAPSVIWASGVLFAAAFVVLVPLGVWLYTLLFALSSLWFSHYCLAALQALRNERAARGTTARRADDKPLIDTPTPPLTHEPNAHLDPSP